MIWVNYYKANFFCIRINKNNEFNKIISYYNGIENVLTFNGIEIYKLIFEKYTDINCRRYNTTANFNFTNQPYNFTFDIYLEDNKKNWYEKLIFYDDYCI